MASNPKHYIPPEKYLEMERKAEHKSEYYNGEIFAMAGASPRHVLITGNTVTAFNVQLRGKGCVVFSADLRVKGDVDWRGIAEPHHGEHRSGWSGQTINWLVGIQATPRITPD